MVKVGDEIEVSANKVGQLARTGKVLAVRGRALTVQWPNGDQTTLIPAPGTVRVVGAPTKGKRSTKPSSPTKKKQKSARKKK